MNEPNPSPETDTPEMLDAEFDAAWEAAMPRFTRIADLPGLKINLRHPETKAILPPHEGLAGTLDEWAQIQSVPDREACLFETALDLVGQDLPPWAIANVLTHLRHPDEAFDVLQKAPEPESGGEDCARHCAAYARALLSLARHEVGLEWAKAAAAADPESTDYQVLLADALSLAGRDEDAQPLYAGALASSPAAAEVMSSEVETMFATIFSRESGAVPSPIFALEIGNMLSDEEQAAQFWAFAEAEYYDSPHFRMQHAYRLLEGGNIAESIAKLAALVREMPWLREASFNLLELLNHVDPSGERVLKDLRKEVASTIAENGWTKDGLRLLQIEITE